MYNIGQKRIKKKPKNIRKGKCHFFLGGGGGIGCNVLEIVMLREAVKTVKAF